MCRALCWGFADIVPFKPHSSFNQETLTKQLPGITVGDRQTRIMKMVKTTKSQFPTKGTFCVGRYTDSNQARKQMLHVEKHNREVQGQGGSVGQQVCCFG